MNKEGVTTKRMSASKPNKTAEPKSDKTEPRPVSGREYIDLVRDHCLSELNNAGAKRKTRQIVDHYFNTLRDGIFPEQPSDDITIVETE